MCLNPQPIFLSRPPAFNVLNNLHELSCEDCQNKESRLVWTPFYMSAS